MVNRLVDDVRIVVLLIAFLSDISPGSRPGSTTTVQYPSGTKAERDRLYRYSQRLQRFFQIAQFYAEARCCNGGTQVAYMTS
jgi:hypothetical protein